MSELVLSNNLFSGIIPRTLNKFTNLWRLKVSNNLFHGNLEILFPLSMQIFSAYSNNFSGDLPAYLFNCTQLQLLDLRRNGLTGTLPQHLVFLPNLQVLSIGYNNIQGVLPQWITNLTNLQVLELSNNKFSGRIPSNLVTLQGFQINGSSQLSSTKLYEEVDIDMKGYQYTLNYVLLTNTMIDLSSNNFVGEIPANMGNLHSLRLLNLSHNQLEGKIPGSLGEISTLEELDLSVNNLSGMIPQELSKLSMLASFNFSSNDLCGPIPTGTQFVDVSDVSVFEKNKCLCGHPLPLCKEKQVTLVMGTTKVTMGSNWLHQLDEQVSLFALGLGVGIGFGGVVFVMTTWEKARHWMMPLIRDPSMECIDSLHNLQRCRIYN
jgi:hypothetical protein